MAGSKRFEIDLGVNASGAVKGARDVAMAFADLEDAVGDAADESTRSGRDLDSFAKKVVDAARKAGKSDDEIKDALRTYGVSAKDAERAIGRVGDELKDTGRTGARSLDDIEDSLRDVQRQSKHTEDSISDIDARGFGRLKEGAHEVTQEIGQNLGETVSSIRGDLSDLGQVGQDTLGGLAATLAGTGPAGIAGAAAVAAGAVGLGLVTAEIQEQNKHVQELKQYFADAWKAAVEGGRNYIDLSTMIAEMNSIQFDPERADEYKRIQEDANKLGLDRVTLLQAAAGDQEALNVVLDRSNGLLEANREAIKRGKKEGFGSGERLMQLSDEEVALTLTNDRWKQYGDISAENQQKARDAARAMSETLLRAVDDADSATKAVDDFGNVLITLPSGQEIVIDAKTGQASTDVSKFKKDTDEVVEQLDGSEINLVVKTALSDAQKQINRFISLNDGKAFKLRGRVTVDQGGWGG